MLKKLLITLVLFVPGATSAQSNLTIPWDEFRSLYTERLRHEFELALEDDTPQAIVTISEATYEMSLSGENAALEVTLKGRVVQGQPEPIALFNRGFAITEVLVMQGGTLVSEESGYRFFSNGETDFEVALEAALTIGEDQRSRFVSFTIPSAVKNVLAVDVSAGLALVDVPGIKQPDGRYYFSPETRLELRFADATRLQAPPEPSLDSFTKIALEGNKYVLSTTFVPNQQLPDEVEIDFPAPLNYLDTSLRRSFVKRISDQSIVLALPRDWTAAFELRFELDVSPDFPELHLPKVLGNQGREGEFQLVQPVEARIRVDGEGLERRLSSARLSKQVQDAAKVGVSYLATGIDTTITLDLERFAAVSAPEVVLDAIHFYTSFAENGTAISVLRLDLPATTDNRLQLKAIPDADIWSVMVNGADQSLYTHQPGTWVVPLPENEPAVVELTYVHRRDKLGLEGQLPVNVPEIGLAAQHVYVGIALAERVELVAIESDLVPSDGTYWPSAKSFVGTAYYFEYPFYRGESLIAIIYYKEPLTQG